MYLFRTLLVSIFLLLSVSLIQAQDSNTVKYSLFLEKTVSLLTLDTKVAGGEFKEGQSFIIPEAELPSSPINFAIYQDLYNALVGGRFGIDYGALDKDIEMKIFMRNLDPGVGKYEGLGEDQDTLFSYFEIRIWELPDSNFFPEETSYYFNDGYYAHFSIPKSENFFKFLNIMGMAPQDSLAFAFLEEEDNVDDWNSEGIVTIDEADSIRFKAIHLSRIGGGRRRIAYSTATGISVEELKGVPQKINLNQNYPNPFNPSTQISYSITEAGNVSIDIYNILGKHIFTLIDEHHSAGNYNLKFSADDISKNLPSGIYVYSMKHNNSTLTKKMILMK